MDMHDIDGASLSPLLDSGQATTIFLLRLAAEKLEDRDVMDILLSHPATPRQVINFISLKGPEYLRETALRRLNIQVTTKAVEAAGTNSAEYVEAPADSEEEGSKSMVQAIQGMNISQKRKLAMKGDKVARSLLIKDSNKEVALSVLENPQISEQEIENIAISRNVSEQILRVVASNREWLKNNAVMSGLVSNPKTPVGIALQLINGVRTKELANLVKSRDVPEVLKAAARKLLERRTKAGG